MLALQWPSCLTLQILGSSSILRADMYDILLIIATIIGVTVGALLPISSNMRRNPIRDMRDE